MKKSLLFLSLFALVGITLFAQTPYAYYPYYNEGVQTPFAVPTDKVDADLVGASNRAPFVMLGSWFDQTNSGGIPSYLADEGVTIIKDPTETDTPWTPQLTDDRIVTEAATATEVNTQANWDYTKDVFSKRGQTLFYTVNFSAAGDYKIYLRHNENKAVTYVVDVFSKADMDLAIKTFTLNCGGLTTTADAFSTDNSTQYVTAGGGTSLWVKTVDAVSIASPGDYVIKIKTTKGFRYNFGGFTIFPKPASASAEITLTKPVAPGAAVAVNTAATLKALATPAGTNTISKVEFFEGENLLGEGTLVGGFYEFAWAPTATGSYVISAKLTESDATETTTSTTSNLEVVSSLMYVSRTAWTDAIQAEDYDLGGSEYGAFYDITSIAASAASGYRTDGTDTKPGPVGQNVQLGNGGTGWTVGYTSVGETLNYTIKDVPTGTIKFSVNYATPNTNAGLKVSLNGTELGTIAIPSTTDWSIYDDASLGAITVTGDADSDDDVLTLEFVGSGSNLDYFKLETDATTSTPQVNGNKLSVYPNPSKGTFTINTASGETSTYRILNLSGQEVQSGRFVGKTNIEITSGKGVYLLQTRTLDKVSTQKIVVN